MYFIVELITDEAIGANSYDFTSYPIAVWMASNFNIRMRPFTITSVWKRAKSPYVECIIRGEAATRWN